MNTTLAQSLTGTPPRIIRYSGGDIFATTANFWRSDVEMILWERNASPDIRTFNGLTDSRDSQISINIKGDPIGVIKELRTRFETLSDGHSEKAQDLLEDFRLMIEIADSLSPGSTISAVFTIGSLPLDDCIFHTDLYKLALLCTYDGPGTEYVESCKVDSVKYQAYWEKRLELCEELSQCPPELQLKAILALRDLDERNDFLKNGSSDIAAATTGDIAIWKGDASGQSALLHRMPRTAYRRTRFMVFVE
jgi:hypothetical protein